MRQARTQNGRESRREWVGESERECKGQLKHMWMQHGVHLATAAATNDQKLHCHFYAQFVLRKYCESFSGRTGNAKRGAVRGGSWPEWTGDRLPRWRHLAKLHTNACVCACAIANSKWPQMLEYTHTHTYTYIYRERDIYIFMCVDFWLLYNISFNAQFKPC